MAFRLSRPYMTGDLSGEIIIRARPGKTGCGDWVCERSVCSAPRLLAFAVVCLAYFLLAVVGAHLWTGLAGGHGSVEVVHLPPDAAPGKGSAAAPRAWTSLAGNDAAAQIANADPEAPGQHALDGPGLIGAVATVVAALLASRFRLLCRPAFAVFLAVLGVGRWHRSVVLHL